MRASSEQGIRAGMDVEDEVLATLQDPVRESAELRQTIEEKDRTIGEQAQLIKALQRRSDQ
jgi:hypothetical protein